MDLKQKVTANNSDSSTQDITRGVFLLRGHFLFYFYLVPYITMCSPVLGIL
jgi:hypothetical protein